MIMRTQIFVLKSFKKNGELSHFICVTKKERKKERKKN